MCWKDKVSDVYTVPLQLQECARDRQVCWAIECARSPPPLCGTISFVATKNVRGKRMLENKCHRHSRFLNNTVPILPRAIAITQRLSGTKAPWAGNRGWSSLQAWA